MKKELQKIFIELIKISEVFPDEKEVSVYVQNHFKQAGLDVKLDNFGNIIATKQGGKEPILLSTHMDVPEPNPNVKFEIEGDIIRSSGANILGADPKSGLACLLLLAHQLKDIDMSKAHTIEFVITRGEEAGLVGASHLDYSMVKSKFGLVLDEDGPITQVPVKAPGYHSFDGRIIGKQVHTREPEIGVNALQVLSDIIQKTGLGYACEGVTYNLGVVSGGTARNTVPGEVNFAGELRSFDNELLTETAQKIKTDFEAVCKSHGAEVQFNDFELKFKSYSHKDSDLQDKLAKIFAKQNLKPNFFETFGGTDANVFNAKGIDCVPLGSAYYNAHEHTEYINLQEMQQINEFLIEFIQS